MNKRASSKKHGIIHFYAQCKECSFDSSYSTNKTHQKVRNEVVSHVKKTGHTVTIEAGTSTDYFLTTNTQDNG